MFKNGSLKCFIYATSVLAGTIIGVGLFSLPYLTLQVGWLTMLLYFFILGGLVALLHVLFGELVIRTPDHKRLPGIADYYWGKRGKRLTMVTHMGCLLGSVLAYIIVGGGFLRELLSAAGFDIGLTAAVIAYLAVGGIVLFFGLALFENMQFAGLIGFFLVLLGLAWLGRGEISLANVFARDGGTVTWFAPYGAIMFSLWGATLIPQIEEILCGHKRLLTRVILLSIALPAVVYLFFIVIVLGISGAEATPSALIGLGERLGQGAEALILIFGLITTVTSFLAIGLTLMQVLEFDLGVRKIGAWLAVILSPLLLYLAGVKDFLELIIFIGAVFLAIDGINILLMYRKGVPLAAPWKRRASIVLIFVLLGGIFYELNNVFTWW